jgi:hypothetical protein
VTKRLEPHNVLYHRCPSCGARPGQNCRAANRKGTRPHQARYDLARAAGLGGRDCQRLGCPRTALPGTDWCGQHTRP